MQQHNSMPLSTLSTERQDGVTAAAAGVSLMEVSTFMTEQLKAVARMEARMDKQALEAKAEMEAQRLETRRQAVEAKAEMEAQRLENDKLRSEAAETRAGAVVREIVSAKSCVSEGQLEMLQTRLDALHEAKLLTDDEVGALEDCVADYIDCCASLNPAAAEIGVAAEKVKKMVGLSEGMGKDGMLARQLRRKFAVGQ
jgi:regulator of protease activity HflC (stomatin/prohibitin superfamily)